jgi:hypothetical protein
MPYTVEPAFRGGGKNYHVADGFKRATSR